MSKKKEQETFTTSGSLSSLTTEQKQELNNPSQNLDHYILSGENISDEALLIADLNQDNSINVSDVVMLVNIILSN